MTNWQYTRKVTSIDALYDVQMVKTVKISVNCSKKKANSCNVIQQLYNANKQAFVIAISLYNVTQEMVKSAYDMRQLGAVRVVLSQILYGLPQFVHALHVPRQSTAWTKRNRKVGKIYQNHSTE